MKSILAICILIAFATFGGFGMLAIGGMSGHHEEVGCPFMPGEQAICDMNTLDHISAWQNTFTVTVPPLFVYLLLFGVVLFAWKYYTSLDFFIRRSSSRPFEEYSAVSFYQELFSSGILNPEAP